MHRRGSVGSVASGRRGQCVRTRCIARTKVRFRGRVSREGSRVSRVAFARPRGAPKMRASIDDSDDGPGCVFFISRQPVSDSLPRAGELACEIGDADYCAYVEKTPLLKKRPPPSAD